MLKLLRLLIAVVALVMLVVLAIDNRGPVELSFWPLPLNIHVPLYWVFLFGLVAGALIGGISWWLSSWAYRREARAMRRRVRAMDYQEQLRRERTEQEILEQARRKTQAIAIEAPRA